MDKGLTANRSLTLTDVLAIWDAYVDHQRGRVSPSTIVRDYEKVRRRILLMQSNAPDLNTGHAVRRWLLNAYSNDITRRTLMQLGAAYRWANFEDLVAHNPFEGLARYLSVRRQKEVGYAAFTLAERDIIIQTFEHHRQFYAPWVKFLFATGCRPEEAAALRWANVSLDCSELLIKEAAPNDTKLVHSTKNYATTRFPCNRKLQLLLQSLKPSPLSKEKRVFLSVTGKQRFDYTNFQRRVWKPLVEDLVDQGLVAFYLSQYHTRHTFITEMCKRRDVQDVSYLCRVSVGTLQSHYLSRSREVDVPDF